MEQTLKIGKKIPDNVAEKAKEIFKEALVDKTTSRLLIRKHQSGCAEAISVGRNYRIFRRRGDKCWMLVTHSDYNKKVK